MFKNTFQSGFLSILYSIGSKPLQIWDKKGAHTPPLPPPPVPCPPPRAPPWPEGRAGAGRQMGD